MCGITAILFGILLDVGPATAILSLVWLIGTRAIVFGVVLVVLAFRLRRVGKDVSALAAAR